MNKSVQFDTADDVVLAYEGWKFPNWAIFCGKDLMFPYDEGDISQGSQVLDDTLKKLQRSAAIYTLRVYKDIPDDGITDKTPYRGSFNFKLLDRPMGYMSPELHSQYGGSVTALLSELNALRIEKTESNRQIAELTADVAELEQELDELGKKQGQDPGMLGKVEQYVPQVLRICEMLGLTVPGNAAAQPAGRLAGVPGEAVADLQAAEQQISQALQVLCEADPRFPELLMKMSRLATKDKSMFLFYMNQVNGMQL